MLTLFFRKPSENFHSIENLFFSLKKYIEKEIPLKTIFLPYHKGIKRILNLPYVWLHRDKINHITGDVNYIALALPKKNTILTIHDIGSILNSNQNKIKKVIIKFLWLKLPLKRVKKITVISEFSKNEVLKYFKIPQEKIKIIPNCVSDDFKYTPLPINKKPIILHIGTKVNKNLEGLILAAKDINCKLLIIGKLNDKQKQLLEKNKLDYINRVNISTEEMIKAYQQSDILFFASFYEGFGLPILEAQAIGRPIITSNISPMKEVAADGALLINPYSVQEIKNAIIELITNKTLVNSLIDKGLKNVQKYKAKNIAQEYIQLYREFL